MSGTHGVFQHRTGYFYTILEEDFCEVYKMPGVNEVCRAYITSILEHLTNKQFEATGRDDDIWVYMSLPEMERRMRHACSQRTIHKELQGMVKEGFLTKRRATGKATMEYKLNIKKLRKALAALPEAQSCNSATSYLANLQDQSSNSARLILQNDKNDLANLQPRIHREETKEYTEITERERGFAFAQPHALTFYENKIHSHDNPQDVWNCEAWRNAHNDASCADYQAYIDSGQREEADTEPRITAVNSEIGATDDNPTLAHHRTLLVREHHNQTADHPAQDLAIGATDGNVTTRDHSGTGISDRSPARGSLLKVQSPTGNPNGATHTQQPTQVAIASTPGEAATPPAAITRQSWDSPVGGAAADEDSRPRASGKQPPLSLTEDEPTVRPETPAQRRKRIEQREKEIWALVEAKLETKFTRTQRLSQANVAGMENLIEDETDDKTIKTALDRLDNFWRAQFNLKQFHALIPGLLAAQAPPKAANGKIAPQEVPVERWSMAKHKKMLKEMEHNLQA